MLQVNNLSLKFNTRVLFENVNLKFEKGNCYGVIGANGAGKSTFLRVLSGEIESTTGSIVMSKGERMSVLKQDHNAYDEYKVLDTVIMGNTKLYSIMKEKDALYSKEDFTESDGIKAGELEAEFADLNGWNAESDAAILLSGLGIDVSYHEKLMKDLSGAEKVKVLLASALFGDPDILILDEPTSGLDPLMQNKFVELLLEEKKKEQEELLTELKEEQKKFGVEVLEVAEMALLKVQEDVINDSGSSISSLKGAISQLKALKENQLTMEGPKNKVDSLINAANERISYLEEQARLEAERIAQEESSKNQTPDYWFEIEGEVATGQDIVNYAYNFLGRPYVWGAVGPDTFDCSGFTSYVYRHCAGIEITRTTYTQINVGVPVSYNNMQPGDLVFTYDNEHVGIYVGGGMYINATYPGSTVRVTPVTNFYAARRVL